MMTDEQMREAADDCARTIGFTEDEVLEQHEVLRSAMRRLGVKGPALDEATSAAVQTAQRELLRERFLDWRRRRSLAVVVETGGA